MNPDESRNEADLNMAADPENAATYLAIEQDDRPASLRYSLWAAVALIVGAVVGWLIVRG